MENGKEFDMPSGAKLYVGVGEWDRVKALHDALARELNGRGISQAEAVAILKTAKSYLPGEGKGAPDAAETAGEEKLTVLALLMSKGLAVASSRELELAIFACAEKAFYKPDGTEAGRIQFNAKVPGYAVFDNPACRDKARRDYYEICNAVVEVNLLPFAEALFSMFAARVGKSADIPKSSTATA